MATKLYFHNVTDTQSGTFPTSERGDGNSNSWSFGLGLSFTPLKTMDTTIGTGQASASLASAASASFVRALMGAFVTQPLSSNQTVGGGTMTLNAAENEGNTNSNFWINCLHIYVWRPSTGAIVGHVVNLSTTSSGLGGLEPTAASSEQVTHITGITTNAVSALAGDVIICEIGAAYTQGMATSYTDIFYYDGTTENTTENAVVSNHASYIQFAETLTFGSGGGATNKNKFFLS